MENEALCLEVGCDAVAPTARFLKHIPGASHNLDQDETIHSFHAHPSPHSHYLTERRSPCHPCHSGENILCKSPEEGAYCCIHPEGGALIRFLNSSLLHGGLSGLGRSSEVGGFVDMGMQVGGWTHEMVVVVVSDVLGLGVWSVFGSTAAPSGLYPALVFLDSTVHFYTNAATMDVSV